MPSPGCPKVAHFAAFDHQARRRDPSAQLLPASPSSSARAAGGAAGGARPATVDVGVNTESDEARRPAEAPACTPLGSGRPSTGLGSRRPSGDILSKTSEWKVLDAEDAFWQIPFHASERRYYCALLRMADPHAG